MHLNIAHKIFGIALVVLALMVMVAAMSIRLTAHISNELNVVAGQHLPLSESIARIDVRILEQGLLLQRLFVLTQRDATAAHGRINVLEREIGEAFTQARALFHMEEGSSRPPEEIDSLYRAFLKIEVEYRRLEKFVRTVRQLHHAGEVKAFETVMIDLNRQQDAVDAEIATLRRFLDEVTGVSVKRSDKDEKFLLYFNAVMTAAAAVLGLGFASVVTLMLVRNVRSLVRGTERVEAGDLDTEVQVLSRDEVGRLTHSFNDMVVGLRMKERIKDTFGKYMDPRIVTNLLENPEAIELGGERREMTVMFIDLKGYTAISERLEPAELVRIINLFFSHMTASIADSKGVVNDFHGDAVMAFWGPPFTGADEHARLGCQAALSAVERFHTFRAEVAKELGPRVPEIGIDLRVGVSTGDMVVGNIGSVASRKFSVIGDPVNLGARLEGANKNYGTRIMISERTRVLAGEAIQARELDLIRVKGKIEPTRVFELLPRPPAPSPFADGLVAYRAQDWIAAIAAFEACQAQNPEDPVPPVFLDRIRHLRAEPPGADWDGVWVFQTK